jgi:peptide/nickel transport system permease protein
VGAPLPPPPHDDMWRYLVGRLLQTVLSMLVVVSIVFVLTRLSGNPIFLLLDVNATQRDQEILARHLGLDKPLPVQYGLYVMNIAMGDFGHSIISRRPVVEHIWERLPATVELGFVAMFLSVLLGVPLGMYSAVRRGGAMDSGARVFAVLGQSLPTFWLGLMLILFFGVVLGVLPAGGRGTIWHLILPAFTLGYFTSAAILRLTRSAMLEVLGSDYIKFARLKGLHEQVVLWKHGLRNALLPVVTFAVLLFVQFLGGAVVTETVFAWPGLGRLILESITTRDYPIVQAGVLVLSALYLTGNLCVDLLYSYLNPRIRHAGR